VVASPLTRDVKSKKQMKIIMMDGRDDDSAPYAIVLHDPTDDPHGHRAWRDLNRDFREKLKLPFMSSTGTVAFAEFTDSYQLDQGVVHLNLDADPGEITLTATDGDTLHKIIQSLMSIGHEISS
jgi:hypothetical protein